MARFGARLLVSMVVVSMLVMAVPATLRAQTQQKAKLSELLPNLYFDSLIGNLTALDAVFPNFDITQSALDSLTASLTTAQAIDALVGNQVSSFPLGSSAGGFAWTFDPALGTFSRVSQSFGPVFAERALTVGKNRFNLGFNFQRATFNEVQGKDLDGEINVYTGGAVPGGTVFIQDALHLDLSANTFGLFATYGLTSRLDFGVAVPIVHVSMDARIDKQVGANGTLQPSVIAGPSAKDSATGIGDIVLRGKYNVWSRSGGGLAAGIDLRLPTADEEELLGIGGSQTKIYAIASGASGRFSPHFNIGYVFSGESSAAKSPDTFVVAPPNEFIYAGGVDVAVTPKLTVLGDITGRNLIDFGKISIDSTPFGSNFTTLGIEDGNLNTVLGSVGVKFNVFGTSLISANVLFPLNNNGLTDNLTWLLGFERSFSIKK